MIVIVILIVIVIVIVGSRAIDGDDDEERELEERLSRSPARPVAPLPTTAGSPNRNRVALPAVVH